MKLKKEDVLKVGQWTPTGGINVTDPSAFYDTHVPNITLIVMTREVSLMIFYLFIYLFKGYFSPLFVTFNNIQCVPSKTFCHTIPFL